MSKLPLETRPLRLAPDVAKVVEERLKPLSGKTLEAAQQAVLKVYKSGTIQSHEKWVAAYQDAIAGALDKKVSRGP